jgi:hypothetical protein
VPLAPASAEQLPACQLSLRTRQEEPRSMADLPTSDLDELERAAVELARLAGAEIVTALVHVQASYCASGGRREQR